MSTSEKNQIDGILLIDKPEGITSFDVIRVLKRKLRPTKIGHAGTLDPLATGLLVILLGKGTKLSNRFLEATKAYSGVILLGKQTDTDDICGKIIKEDDNFRLGEERNEILEKIKEKFLGEQEQIPPQYSAIKQAGKKSYELARKGIEVKHQARKVKIEKLELEFLDEKRLRYEIVCSKGFYVRSFARDLGEFLGTYACLESIRRIASTPFRVEQAVSLDEPERAHVLISDF